MPIIAIYALIAAVIFGAGYGTAWKQGQQQTAVLEASIESANYQASAVLAAKSAEVEKLTADQAISNLSLEAEHTKNIELVANSGAALDAARRMWASHQPRCSGSLPKAGNSGIDKKDDAEGYYLDAGQLSEGVDALVQRADIESADTHTVMQFLKNIPTELRQ